MQLAVLFTGHFADEQLAMIDRIANDWNAAGTTSLRVLSLSVNGSDAAVAPDHAGIFETSAAVSDVARPGADGPAALTGRRTVGRPRRRRDGEPPARPRPIRCTGCSAPIPDGFDPARATDLLGELVTWTVVQVDRPVTAG